MGAITSVGPLIVLKVGTNLAQPCGEDPREEMSGQIVGFAEITEREEVFASTVQTNIQNPESSIVGATENTPRILSRISAADLIGDTI